MEPLKDIRLRLGLTQRKMAQALNTPLSTYLKWEQGKRRVPGIVYAIIHLIGKYKGALEFLLGKPFKSKR